MNLNKLFPKKELTEKEKLEREYHKEMKKIERKLFKKPFEVNERIEEATILMDKAIKDGLMTEETKEKNLDKINKAMGRITKASDKIHKYRWR